MTKLIKKVLIANRGEIAVRIIRTLRDMGIQSVAVYSDADVDSYHRTIADQAVRLPGRTSAVTYLNTEALINAIKISGADAVHPGYGFLSENPDFVQKVDATGAKFIGPSAESMRLLGDKVEAKKLMRKNKVQVTPGSEGALSSLKELSDLVKEMGFPLILKAAAGGGGRGMRVVKEESELKASYEACRREAVDYFGYPEVFAERYIQNPRHIEVQVLCDSKGNGVYLYERDCSVQRRHQKLLEEAPSMFLTVEKRKELGEIAVRAALAAKYEGVGTVEFIAESPDQIYFMEMNTRIQVEHTVTELICQKDLVSEQIKVACGETLSFNQKDLKLNGWALEARINAENPAKNFLPAPGTIKRLRLPEGPYIRVDTHIYEGYTIPPEYDSMIAKVIVWGATRMEAILRLKRALKELIIEGVPTTTKFHEAVLEQSQFLEGSYDTGFITTNESKLTEAMENMPTSMDKAYGIAAAILSSQQMKEKPNLEYSQIDSRQKWTAAARIDSTNRMN